MIALTRRVFDIMKYIKEKRFNKSFNNEPPSDKKNPQSIISETFQLE